MVWFLELSVSSALHKNRAPPPPCPQLSPKCPLSARRPLADEVNASHLSGHRSLAPGMLSSSRPWAVGAPEVLPGRLVST